MEINKVLEQYLDQCGAEFERVSGEIRFLHSFPDSGRQASGWIVVLGLKMFEVGFDLLALNDKQLEFVSAFPNFLTTLFATSETGGAPFRLCWQSGRQYLSSPRAAAGTLKMIFSEAGKELEALVTVFEGEPTRTYPMSPSKMADLACRPLGHA